MNNDDNTTIFDVLEDKSNEDILMSLNTNSYQMSPTTHVSKVDDQVSPLAYAIIEQRSPDVIEAILQMPINEPSLVQGNMPLHFAVMHENNEDIIKMLIRLGGDINRANNEGMSPLALAVSLGYSNNVNALLHYCSEEMCPTMEEVEDLIDTMPSSNDSEYKKTKKVLEKYMKREIKSNSSFFGGKTRKEKYSFKLKSKKNGKRFDFVSKKNR